jgi:peptidoglycan/LPS O-acetylase OafA/YrhL
MVNPKPSTPSGVAIADATMTAGGALGSRRLYSIQYQRAIAAIMVVFFHVLNQYTGFLALVPTGVGRARVDLFFVISGFVMVM